MPSEITFEIGGRYRNRLGWYEVLDIVGDKLLVRYEADGTQAEVSSEILKRIFINITLEEASRSRYADTTENQRFFKTVGFLSKHSFIEAIIPLKSKPGFDSTYCRIKGTYPRNGQAGYYIHPDAGVDKWGVEMRLTFPSRTPFALDFGRAYSPVSSPQPDEMRVNSNELCYWLLGMGFNLGNQHDIARITSNIPESYKVYFLEGLNA